MPIVPPVLRRNLLACTTAAAFTLPGLPAHAQSYGQPYPYSVKDQGYRRPIDQSLRQTLPLYRAPIWEGLYIGGHLGGDFAASVGYSGPGLAGRSDADGAGVTGGLHAGYNWQFPNNLVAGFEFDASAKSNGSSATYAGGIRADAAHDWLTSARLRLGYASGNTLFYATGGYAVGNLDVGLTAPGFSVRRNETFQGYVAGGGIEMKFAPNWSGRVEGLYYGFTKTITSPIGDFRGDGDYTTVRAGLTYHFN